MSAQHEHQDEETEAEVVEAVAVAADGEAEQLDLLDPHAVVAVGHALPARGDFLDDEAERDRGDDQIDAGKAQRRETDERADGAGEHHRERQIDEKRHAEPLHVAGGIGADGKEGGVTERYLPGEAGEDQEPDADNRIDEDEDDLALQVGADGQRRGENEKEKHAIGPPIAAVAEEPDVLAVVGLKDRPHRSTPSCAG